MEHITTKVLSLTLLYLIFVICSPALQVEAQVSVVTPDSACRNCHDGSAQAYEFPSGESVTVGVDVAALDQSPHSTYASEPVPCAGCHAGSSAQYRYPHHSNPAETHRDFIVEVSANCESCHYPHNPFHPILGKDASELEGETPVCADCHGSHDIARVEAIADAMPARCLACHTDQDDQWVAGFLAARPGMGAGSEGYAGSTRCNGCHDDVYFTWRETHHASFIQDVRTQPDAVLGDFDPLGEDVTVGLDDVAYTIGNRWRQAYLVQPTTTAAMQTLTSSVTSTLALLPVQWSVQSEEWVPLEEGGETPKDWIAECGSCHVTGLDTETSGFTEFGAGCESCHGPAADHAADPENVKPYAEVDDQVCGSCHSRGLSRGGYHFPATYRPGDTLADHFTLTASDSDLWPDGSAKRNHQQYMDWQLGSAMALSQQVKCATCHAVHGGGKAVGQLRAPLNDVCVQCHGEQEALARHTPFHQQALEKRTFTCADCHMPLMATTAEPYDLHIHSFLQPDPEGTIDHGGIETMPNACNQCHTGGAESPEWAVETIAHARTLRPEASFYGPGPTPTSPPPPTPMPAVGQVAKLEVTPPLWWLRLVAIALAGVIVASVVVWFALGIRSRRNVDA